jgi:hypothetical protein
VKITMASKTVHGVIELRPQVFAECPAYTTLGLRTHEGQLIEVFLPTEQVARKSDHYQLGQRLNLTGGEWYVEPEADGAGEYTRWWPSTVRYDA